MEDTGKEPKEGLRLERWKPAVRRRWLYVLAGSVWFGVGGMLSALACVWLARAGWKEALPLAAAGVAAGVVVYGLGFIRIIRKNLERLERAPERACLFSFQAWKSYLIVGVMIAMGVTLRRSSLSRSVLAVPYAAMGCALLLGSTRYFRRFRRRPNGRT